MLIDKSEVTEAQRIYEATLFKSFSETQSFVEPIASTQLVNTAEVKTIGVLANTTMRKWLGERVVRNIDHVSQLVKVETYENTLGIDANDFEDDRWNLYAPKFASMGEAAKHLESEVVAGILEGTLEVTGYDGLKLLANTHQMAGTSFDNYATAALAKTSFEAGLKYYADLVNDSGKPAANVPTHLVVKSGGAAAIAAAELIKSNIIFEGSVPKSNLYQGKVEIIENPYLTSNTFWALLSLNSVERPVLFYRRYAKPQFTFVRDPESKEVFMNDRYLAGTKHRCVGAVGSWMKAYGSTGTT